MADACTLLCPTDHRYTEAIGTVKASPFSVPGTYEIEYVMVDEQGNRGSKTRTLVVVTAASSSSGLSSGGAAGVVLVLLLLIALAASSYSSTSASATTACLLVIVQPLVFVLLAFKVIF